MEIAYYQGKQDGENDYETEARICLYLETSEYIFFSKEKGLRLFQHISLNLVAKRPYFFNQLLHTVSFKGSPQ